MCWSIPRSARPWWSARSARRSSSRPGPRSWRRARPRLRLQREAEQRGWLKPAAVYGYFPVQSDGQDLVVYDPSGFAAGSLTARGKIEERLRFTFPRQAEREGLCLSDYFQPADSSRFDLVAMQVVTVGPYVDELSAALNARGEYSEAL